MLKVKNIKKNYDDFTLDCSLEVRPGCITGLIGQNGAGKSTTFKAILNLIHLDGGEIELFGKSATALTAADKQRLGCPIKFRFQRELNNFRYFAHFRCHVQEI